jgi:molybdopterin-biosynthesis enzyme MoeA-like protein
MGFLAERLTELGIRLSEARVVPDVPEEIVAAVNALRARYDHVFTTGGIGPTHDDITAECIARAFGVPLLRHPDAVRRLEAHYEAGQLNEARLRMANVPEGGTLIDNPVSAAPGFRIGNVHVMAGVPVIMKAMLEAIAPTLKGGKKVSSVTIRCGVGEGTIGGPFGRLQEEFPDVKMGSYPQMGQSFVMTELVLRSSDEARLAAAATKVREMVAAAHKAAGLPPPEDPY